MTRIFAAELGLFCSVAFMVALLAVAVLSSLIMLELIRSDKAVSGRESGHGSIRGQWRMHRLTFPRSRKRFLLYISFGIVLVAQITNTVLFANDLMNNNLLHLIPQVRQDTPCFSSYFIILFTILVGISLVGVASAFVSQEILENLRLELTHTDHPSSGYEIGTIYQPSELLRLHTLAFPISRKRYLYIALRRITIVVFIIAIVLFGISLYYLRNMSQTISPCR
jgi:hypothetical protein